MRSVLLLPLLLGFSVPAFAVPQYCPESVIKEGEVAGSGTYCRTSAKRWHSNNSCKCPNPGFKPDHTKICRAYSMVLDSSGMTELISPSYTDAFPFQVNTCFEPGSP